MEGDERWRKYENGSRLQAFLQAFVLFGQHDHSGYPLGTIHAC